MQRQCAPETAVPPAVYALLRGIDRLGRIDGWIGSLCLASLTFLMILEVLVRTLSNIIPAVPAGIPVAWEYSSYLMAVAFTFGAAMTLRAGGHIRVTILIGSLNIGVVRWIEFVLAVVGALFVGFLACAMTEFTWEAFVHNRTSEISGTPLWIPQAPIAFGLLLFALQFLARAIQAALGMPLEDFSLR